MMNTVALCIAAIIPPLLLLDRKQFSPIHNFVEIISTFWHEMSHAIVASMLNGNVKGIRVEPGGRVRHKEGDLSYTYVYSSSGVTHYSWSGNKFKGFLITSAGYAGPTLLSIAMMLTWFFAGLHFYSLIWTIILALFLLVSRGLYAVLINLVSLAIVSVPLVADKVDTPFMHHLAYILPTMLISSLVVYGFKDSMGIFRSMRDIRNGLKPATGDSDTEKMAEMTGIPAVFWALCFVFFSVATATCALVYITSGVV